MERWKCVVLMLFLGVNKSTENMLMYGTEKWRVYEDLCFVGDLWLTIFFENRFMYIWELCVVANLLASLPGHQRR